MLLFRLFPKKRKRGSKEIEPHEIFLDNLAQKKEEEFGTSKRRLESPLPVKTLNLFAFLVFFAFFVLTGRTFYIQFIEGNHFAARAEQNVLSISNRQLLRGVIYDRNYNQLVYNSPQHDLHFRGRTISSLEKEAIKEVGKIIGEDPGDIYKRIKESELALFNVKKDLSHEELVQLEARIEKLSGFSIVQTAGRDYIEGNVFSHILGYIGKIDRETLRSNPDKYTIHDYTGKMGIERYYENYLTRTGNEIRVERDVLGNTIAQEIIESTDEGENVVLTIDRRLQKIANEKIVEKLEEVGSKKGAVVAMDPTTGEILAMVSVPSYDNNLFRRSGDREALATLFENKDAVFLNRVMSAGYPTGSVIKPLLAAAALEEGIISPEKRIHSPGYITIPNPWNPSQPTIFRDFQAHGWRDMREAIAVSSNVYFYSIGGGYEDQEGLGARRIREYLNLFGWGEISGVDFPAERAGFIPSPEWKEEKLNDAWRIGDSYNLSIGQGYISTTPLQVVSSFAALINGGKLLRPYIVKEIIDDDKNLIKRNSSEIIREGFISPENLKVVKEGMKEATIIGTARSLQALPFSSGAKTGTAQTSRAGVNHNWVTAFVPYDNPEIVITVIIEDIKGVTPVATHLARDILREYFTEEDDKETENEEL